MYEVSLDIKNVKSVVNNFNMNIYDKGMLYYDNLDELHNNKLIKILNDKKSCLTEDNIEIRTIYYKFLKESLPYIHLERAMFNESVDVNYIINDPVDKIYRITFLVDDYQISLGLFSITKFQRFAKKQARCIRNAHDRETSAGFCEARSSPAGRWERGARGGGGAQNIGPQRLNLFKII